MFEYISGFAIIAFETLCCRMFYESFCVELKENKKWCRKLYIVLMPCILYVCSLLLSDWLVIKQVTVIIVISSMMCLYYKISIKKATIFALLYQGLALIVDYIAYASNITFFSIAGGVKKEYAVEGNLVVILSKIVSSLILNTIWVSILYRGGIDAFWAVFISRVPFTAVMAVVEIGIISLLFSNNSKTNKLIKKTFPY